MIPVMACFVELHIGTAEKQYINAIKKTSIALHKEPVTFYAHLELNPELPTSHGQ